MRNRVPIVYLVDSAGVESSASGRYLSPDNTEPRRIFYYNSLMRRKLNVPQIAAVMGPCIAGGAYLPALSDVIIMVERTSFMGLGGPTSSKVRSASGRCRNRWAARHAHRAPAVSRIIRRKRRTECLALIRQLFRSIPSRARRAGG